MSTTQMLIAIIHTFILISAAAGAGFYAGHWQGQTEAYQAVLGSMHDAVGLKAGKAP